MSYVMISADKLKCPYQIFSAIGLDSDESYEGVSEASFKDALVFDSSQKNNGSVNGIKKHR